MAVFCQYCHYPAELQTGAKIYPEHPHLAAKQIWVCKPCKARVGCFEGTDTPLGELANGKLRAARSKAHMAFDPIWQLMHSKKGGDRHEVRRKTRDWLAAQLQLPADEFRLGGLTYDQCLQAVLVCRALLDQLSSNYGMPAPAIREPGEDDLLKEDVAF